MALVAIHKKKYMIHGIIMTFCIVLHTAAIFGIMVPSLLGLDGTINNVSTPLSLLVTTHAALGSIVEVFGVGLILVWINDRIKTGNCFKRKHLMEATIGLWILELVIGAYVYMTLYPLV